MQGEDVTAEIVVDDGAAGSRGRLTVLTLVWRPSDPLAVTMSLVSSPDHPALPRGRWVVLRDFLRYGLEEPTGDGDVRITPEDGHDDGEGGGVAARVWLELCRGERQSDVRVDAGELRDFLDRTEVVLPTGEERPERELDQVIAALLRT